jgi:hypothetical protein
MDSLRRRRWHCCRWCELSAVPCVLSGRHASQAQVQRRPVWALDGFTFAYVRQLNEDGVDFISYIELTSARQAQPGS